jgi:hypothetical protein
MGKSDDIIGESSGVEQQVKALTICINARGIWRGRQSISAWWRRVAASSNIASQQRHIKTGQRLACGASSCRRAFAPTATAL